MSPSNLPSEPQAAARVGQNPAQMQIAVCIPTYRRPGGLQRLLEALALQEPLLNCEITIVVVDNEDSPDTKAVCDEFASRMVYPLRYACELRPGLAYVRNTAVEIAREFADAIAFIDDDEVPSPGWLKYLAACQRLYVADAVSGPVVPCFMPRVPQWVRKGEFFDQPRYRTGTMVPEARISNVLIRKEAFDRVGLFDVRFVFTGGEDVDFFVRLHESGGLLCWSDEAIVEQWVPPSHATLGFLLRKAYWKARINALRSCRSSIYTSVHVAYGVLRSMTGICLLPASLTRGKIQAVKALQRIWSGAGTIAGAAM